MQEPTASGSLTNGGSPEFQKNQSGSVDMQCREFREIADSFLGNELIVETNHEGISHLEHCAECRRDLPARGELRTQLRGALIQAPETPIADASAQRLS